MASLIDKTFGGLSRRYYFRQIIFGLLIAGVMFWLKTVGQPPTAGLIAWFGVNTLLYPYARFAWESIVSFIFGQNIFFVPAVVLLVAKAVTMFMCWKLAIIIAPVGLAWLYWHHSRRASASER